MVDDDRDEYDDKDLDDDEAYEDTDPGYPAVAFDRDWARTRTLSTDGTVFRHQKHPADVDPGVQHKLFVWVCETSRPREHCPCGLYTLTWLNDASTRVP